MHGNTQIKQPHAKSPPRPTHHSGGGLVAHDKLRFAQQRERNEQHSPLPAREFADWFRTRCLREAKLRHQPATTCARNPRRQRSDPGSESQMVIDAELVKEGSRETCDKNARTLSATWTTTANPFPQEGGSPLSY